MKTYFFLLALLLSSGLWAQELTDDPEAARFVTEDIDRFWTVFDAANGQPKAADLEQGYLSPGSQGVQDFIPNRIESAKKLAKKIKKKQAYYQSIRPYSLRIRELENEMRAHYRSFKELYPATVYPEAYFVIGRLNSGGTTGPRSVIMGAEMFGDPTATPAAKIAFDALPIIVIHELVHYQQNYGGEDGLLRQTLKEGAADFIAAVVTNNPIDQHHLDGYAKPKRKEIWDLFMAQKDDLGWKSYRGWMYGGNVKLFSDAPNDLGYWLGFQICHAYYQKATDKKQAIYDILNIRDPQAFLAASGYEGE
ncbi:MAG: hypothetical protein AAF840_13270 [Bacteroidota bacterium]